MKSNYCFIRNYGQLKAGSFIYRVSVGTSDREQIKLALVREFCNQVGCYFKKWSTQVDASVQLAKSAWLKDKPTLATPFFHPSVTISELYDMIVDDSFDLFESNYKPSSFHFWRNLRNSPTYIQLMNKKTSITACQPHQRKNLSYGRLDFRQFMVMGSVVVGILYVALAMFTQFVLNMFGAL